jgi:hypothetical protein
MVCHKLQECDASEGLLDHLTALHDLKEENKLGWHWWDIEGFNCTQKVRNKNLNS